VRVVRRQIKKKRRLLVIFLAMRPLAMRLGIKNPVI
jgi:hypothetical protein